jgi:hypothetical protein
MIKLFHILIIFFSSTAIYAKPAHNNETFQFERIVLSKNLVAECDAQKGDERGPFGITYKDGKITHTFLVMTGVYYDTCKSLEKKINRLKAKQPKLILIGTKDHPQEGKSEIIWRWGAVRSLSGKICISYFNHDCE